MPLTNAHICICFDQIVVVSTLASFTPASPFIFRSYELPVEAEQLAAKMGACAGSSKHLVWQVHPTFVSPCFIFPMLLLKAQTFPRVNTSTLTLYRRFEPLQPLLTT